MWKNFLACIRLVTPMVAFIAKEIGIWSDKDLPYPTGNFVIKILVFFNVRLQFVYCLIFVISINLFNCLHNTLIGPIKSITVVRPFRKKVQS